LRRALSRRTQVDREKEKKKKRKRNVKHPRKKKENGLDSVGIYNATRNETEGVALGKERTDQRSGNKGR